MFDLLITPWIIRVVYWIAQVLLLIIGVVVAVSPGLSYEYGLYDFLGSSGPVIGVSIILLGTIYLRLIFEFFIVIFKISENSSDIKELLIRQKLDASASEDTMSRALESEDS